MQPRRRWALVAPSDAGNPDKLGTGTKRHLALRVERLVKALTLIEASKFHYGDVDRPAPDKEEVLIRVGACGICGSDIHGMDGSSGRRIPPIIMGHEFAGTVEAVGSKVTRFKPGDHVTPDSMESCGSCGFCRQGKANLCDHRRVIGVSCGQYRRQGAFAEYIAVAERSVYSMPESMSFEHAAFAEPVSVALHAVNQVPIRINDTVVVMGAGIIGNLVVQVLRLAGCGRILVVDLDPGRLSLACELGADEGLLSDPKKVYEVVMTRTGGRGADVAMEVVGITPTLQLAIRCGRNGGAVGLVGNVAPSVDFGLQAVVTREISLHGSCGCCSEFGDAIDLIHRRAILVDPLISKVAPLSEGAQWFGRYQQRDHNLIKVMLRP